MFRVKEPATAEFLTRQLNDVTIYQSMVTSSTTDNSNPDDGKAFTSNTGERISEKMVPMLSPAHITNLPKGQAFALLEGSTLYKLRMPLPAVDKDDVMPESLQELTAYMRKNYHISPNWWQSAFSDYAPSQDIATAFQSMSLNRAPSHAGEEMLFGDVETPAAEDMEDEDIDQNDDTDEDDFDDTDN